MMICKSSTESTRADLMQGGYVNPMTSYANHMMVEQYINQKNDVEIKHFGSTMLEAYKQYCKEGAITLILSEVELLKLSGNLLSKTKIGKAVLDKGSEYLNFMYSKIKFEGKLFAVKATNAVVTYKKPAELVVRCLVPR